VRASHPFIHLCKTSGCIMFVLGGGVCKSVALVPSPHGRSEQLLRLASEFRPSHFSYALRASGHVLRPAPRGPTPKSRFLCAGGR
jgi:hypothetical protein